MSEPVLCSFCRRRDSRGMSLDGHYVCLDCLEQIIERENAVMLHPGLRSDLPDLGVLLRNPVAPAREGTVT